jgi:hypothetical protein
MLQQFALVHRIVQQLDCGKLEAMAATEQFVAVFCGAPGRGVVRQQREAGNRPVVAVEQAVVVHEHALAENRLALALDFDMDINAVFPSVEAEDFH